MSDLPYQNATQNIQWMFDELKKLEKRIEALEGKAATKKAANKS